MPVGAAGCQSARELSRCVCVHVVPLDASVSYPIVIRSKSKGVGVRVAAPLACVLLQQDHGFGPSVRRQSGDRYVSAMGQFGFGHGAAPPLML